MRGVKFLIGRNVCLEIASNLVSRTFLYERGVSYNSYREIVCNSYEKFVVNFQLKGAIFKLSVTNRIGSSLHQI